MIVFYLLFVLPRCKWEARRAKKANYKSDRLVYDAISASKGIARIEVPRADVVREPLGQWPLRLAVDLARYCHSKGIPFVIGGGATLRQARGVGVFGEPARIEVIATSETETLFSMRVQRRYASSERWREYYSRSDRRVERVRYISGFDRNEKTPRYYLCEMPPGSVATTIEEALEELKPRVVKEAEAAGRTVCRQGDIFFVETLWSRADLKQRGWRRGEWGRMNILGTNHTAPVIWYHPSHPYHIYVEGEISHRPTFRSPDHDPIHLPDGIWLAVKNTVPISARMTRNEWERRQAHASQGRGEKEGKK